MDDDKHKILIIEDDEVYKMTICHAFTKASINMPVLQFIESNRAIDTLNNNDYDCVFLNNCLSKTKALSFLIKLRSSGISLPIIILIDNNDEKIAEELIKAGATDYIIKSKLSPEIINLVIRNAIRIYHTQAQLAVANQQLQENQKLLIAKNQKIEQQKQQINLQNLKLIEALRLKSQFLATISHELRTPMNAIIGFSQLLLRPKISKLSIQQKDMVERILNNGKNLLMLVNEVIDFSKFQAGKLDLQPEILDLLTLINMTVEEMYSLADAKKLYILVDINLQNPIVYNDKSRLRQIFINLISNAIKFTEVGSIKITIAEITHNIIEIKIQDTGIGIAADNIQYIFEPFRQLDQGIDRKFGGTGLGLPIVNALVNLMGGKIDVESELGKGSLFRLELPRQLPSIMEEKIIKVCKDFPYKKLINDEKQDDYKQEVQSKKQDD